MLRFLVLFVGAFVALGTGSSPAQEAVLGQLYGNGVHAYFAGDFVNAYDQLTAAATAGSRDPRVYYFRGLAYLKLGREPEATQDFKKGAELESKDLNRSFNVARSLERVQGTARQQLETYRVDARLSALAEADKVRKTRFEAIRREEERVLRTQAAHAPAEPISTPEGQPATKTIETDPFGNPQSDKKSAPEAEDKAADEKVEKPDDSGAFGSGDAADKPAAKAKESPFQEEPAADGKSAATSVEKMEGDKPAAEKKSGPIKQSILGALIKGSGSGIKKSLGGGMGSLGNMLPMGKGAPGGNTIPGTKPPASADPFGTDGEEKAAPPKKAGSDKPAEKPGTEKPAADQDPFS
jgi:hypothetical protein